MTEQPTQPSLLQPQSEAPGGPVTCLGITFASDAERRAHFTALLAEMLKDPAFRQIEGFPIGTDEDILALSDPPYYTACPNPFMESVANRSVEGLTKHYSDDETKPYTEDITTNKRHVVFVAHSYHTKVPHEAIVRYILHYTSPGDVVLDGFAGSGMTGVAIRACESPDDNLRTMVDLEWADSGKSSPPWGERIGLLLDISPIATFISRNYTSSVTVPDFGKVAGDIGRRLDRDFAWMYNGSDDPEKHETMNYMVWSDVFSCPHCTEEIEFWSVCVDQTNGQVRSKFECPACSLELTKRDLELAHSFRYDAFLETTIARSKTKPILINCINSGQKYFRKINSQDTEILNRVDNYAIQDWIPLMRMPEGDESRRNDKFGVTHVHHFFTRRNLAVVARLFSLSRSAPLHLRLPLQFMATSMFRVLTVRSLFLPSAYFLGGTGPFKPSSSGTLYIPSLTGERNVIEAWNERVSQFSSLFETIGTSAQTCYVSTQSSTDLANLPPDSVDYIFIDPPFGSNIMYSELNFIWEAWLRVRTENRAEAIVNRSQGKSLQSYENLIARCFSEFFRVLKPEKWITIIFHNSHNAVWNAIQTAIQLSGFVIADVRTLDRTQGTFVQYNTSGAVKQDLVISAYKPSTELFADSDLTFGTEDGAWMFTREHLRRLPVFVETGQKAQIIVERQDYLLFDRMVAFHVQRNMTVPLSAGTFYAGLSQRFPYRDGMYFLPEQAAEYDRRRMKAKEVVQLALIVTDETSAIQWLKHQLTRKPQTFQELHPQFMREIGGWQKHERPLELADLLEQNFLRCDGREDVPSQIHSYLSSNYKDMRNLAKDDPSLRAAGKDRWYVPDSNKTTDLEKLREKALLKEFDEYRQARKKLKVLRLEAVRAGFRRAWQERDYATIIAVAEKIPEAVLQEDPKLLMWYDQAVTRAGGESNA